MKIRVTVLAGEGKFYEFTHEAGYFWNVEGGVLYINTADGDGIAAYAPGAWLKVEDVEVSPDNE